MIYVILGFLMIRPLTQYELKRALERKISPFYSASLGSIQSALRKLEELGWVTVSETLDGRRRKKIYTNTDTGKQTMLTWMLEPIPPQRMEQDAATKLFFLGHLEPQQCLTVVTDIVRQLEQTMSDYETAAAIESRRQISADVGSIARYQLHTLKLGLLHYQAMLDGFRQVQHELQAEQEER
ncbi:PadR family transcriptional regulator [Paenibacillus daejeonensis]|uniref:PadR family transcriptional regulator n=1 Tax=Paenibacillus daejeonensis TaxID=135193 RepID=UPI0003627162|nr:helix-turn-helix transcriptional regulator [Paenibacillus daejeonensis]